MTSAGGAGGGGRRKRKASGEGGTHATATSDREVPSGCDLGSRRCRVPAGLGLARSFRRPARRAWDDSDGRAVSDHTGAMLLPEGVSTEEARCVFDLHPFVKNQVFVVDDGREW